MYYHILQNSPSPFLIGSMYFLKLMAALKKVEKNDGIFSDQYELQLLQWQVDGNIIGTYRVV